MSKLWKVVLFSLVLDEAKFLSAKLNTSRSNLNKVNKELNALPICEFKPNQDGLPLNSYSINMSFRLEIVDLL